MKKILLLGGGLQGLSVAESLKSVGFYVTVMTELETVLKSHFVDKAYKRSITDYEFFLEILRTDVQDLAIPMGDGAAEFLSKNKDLIREKYGTICAVPDYDSMKFVLDKDVFMSFCMQNDIPCPKTISLSVLNIGEAVKRVGFPSLIKPNVSAGSRGITKVCNVEDLNLSIGKILSTYGACTLQEYIDNQEYYYNVMLYRNKNGEIVSNTVIKIVRMHPVSAGSSSCCISVVNDELVQICADCLEKLKWVGFADFDVLQRKDNLEYKIIEINPRVPASLRASTISGINFPELIVNDVFNIPQKKYVYTPGKILRYLGIDILWFLQSPKRFTAKPSWFSFFGRNVFYQDIYINDPSTWITWWFVGLKKLFVR